MLFYQSRFYSIWSLLVCFGSSSYSNANFGVPILAKAQEQVDDPINLKNDYSFADLEPCPLTSLEIAQLGDTESIEPCIIFEVSPNSFVAHHENHSSTIDLVQVTPSFCNNHRDGAVTGVRTLNDDNGYRGVALGFQKDHHVSFRLTSVIAGNSGAMTTEEYDRRHIQILKSMITTLGAQYIIGSCSFAAAIEKEPALEHQAILFTQVGPPGFYADNNPYVFGFHINSDTYPLPNVQALAFLADDTEGGAPSIPVRVVYRSKSEFFFSTCRSAIDKLRENGFTDIKEILYDHSLDHDYDEEINQFDEDFLIGIADEACPPGSGENVGFNPAIFACTLTEQDTLIRRWLENGCRPISLWLTAATWGWANDNVDAVRYFQGGGQWHEAFQYTDMYFDSGKKLLDVNEEKFGYRGTYDQVVSYAIPVLCAQHLASYYRVVDDPNPIADFSDDFSREVLRRALVVLNVDTLFGPVSFNDNQRNVGRGAAGTQWLREGGLADTDVSASFANKLVSPLLQAEETVTIPALSAKNCQIGEFVNETQRSSFGSILSSGCAVCPADTFMKEPSQAFQCDICPQGSTTEGATGENTCYNHDDNLLPAGIIVFGMVAVAVTWMLSFGFIGWLIAYRSDPIVKVSQIEFLVLICIGTIISSSTIIALSFQAGTDEDTELASMGCAIAPFLYTIGWVLQYSSLSAKTFRLFTIMQNNKRLKRVTVTACKMSRIVIFALVVDLIIVITWAVTSPLVYERVEDKKVVDEDSGVIIVESVGRCVSENGNFWYFAGPIASFHIVMVVSTNILLYNVKEVADRYQEQKYVALASMLMLEILIVGIPVVVAVSDSPEATFIVLTGIIALDDIGILCFIFVPKIMFQNEGLEEGVGIGESIMRESARRASTRESMRRETTASYVSSYERPSSSYNGRDSFTARVSPKSKNSPFASMQGFNPSEVERRSQISESIVEETSEDLKMFDSDDSDKNFPRESSGLSSSGLNGNSMSRIRKRGIEAKVSSSGPPMGNSLSPTSSLSITSRSNGAQEDDRPLSRSSSAHTGPQISQQDDSFRKPATNGQDDTSSSLSSQISEQERMMEMSRRLMGEHEKMMQATKEIMNEHERLKQRLAEAQSWKSEEFGAAKRPASEQSSQEAPARSKSVPEALSHEQMKARLLASNAWSKGSSRDVINPFDEHGGEGEEEAADNLLDTKRASDEPNTVKDRSITSASSGEMA